jgi:hypothetical protein
MSQLVRRVSVFAALVTLAACTDNSSTGPTASPSMKVVAAAGANSGGANSSGGSVSTQPSFVGHVDSSGVIPSGFYYGGPSNWWVGGRVFQSVLLTRFKPLAGPIVVGACVTVSYNTGTDGIDYFTDMKSELEAVCVAAANGTTVSGKKVVVP